MFFLTRSVFVETAPPLVSWLRNARDTENSGSSSGGGGSGAAAVLHLLLSFLLPADEATSGLAGVARRRDLTAAARRAASSMLQRDGRFAVEVTVQGETDGGVLMCSTPE